MEEELRQAFESRAWYPLAGIIITILLGVWKKLQPALFWRIPQRWQWVPALSVASLGAFVVAYQTGETWLVAVIQGLSAGLAAIGAHHTTKRVTGNSPEKADQ